MTSNERNNEIREAIEAGRRALRALNDAEHHLKAAQGFGIWDILGGGLVSSWIKHSKVDDAQRCVEHAGRELRNFNHELQDLEIYDDLHISFDGTTKFIDMFFDNFIMDIFVQSKINDARQRVIDARRNVEEILYHLNQMLDKS